MSISYIGRYCIILCTFLSLSLIQPIASFAQVGYTDMVTATTDDAVGVNEIVTISPRFFYGLGIDVLMVLLIILIIYYPNYKKLDTVFTFIVFNIVIFLLTFVLNKVKISMGAAFGLFAVFSMLRYRTEGIDLKDMTYLFIFIALGLITGIELDLDVLLVICAVIFLTTLVLDSKLLLRREEYQNILYERIEMVKPELRQELIEELKKRTGLNIHRITICKLDYLKDVATIRVYYYHK